jgi:hypothetical protein
MSEEVKLGVFPAMYCPNCGREMHLDSGGPGAHWSRESDIRGHWVVSKNQPGPDEERGSIRVCRRHHPPIRICEVFDRS